MPCRDSLHREIEILMSSDYLMSFDNSMKKHTLQNKSIKISYSKLKIKNIIISVKGYLLLKLMMKLQNISQKRVILMKNTH